MQQIVADRENGICMSDGIVAFDDRLNPLSVGYLCEVTLDTSSFSSAEHALWYLRALACNDQHAMRKISSVNSARQASLVPIAQYKSNVWRNYEYKAMQIVTGAKVRQHKFVREALKLTGYKRLVYASPQDRYFSCGLNLTDPNVMYPQFWLGQNQLGSILEQYRKTI